MSTSTAIRCERGALQATAVLNGRVRVDLCLKARATGETIALEEINLSRSDERERLADRLPDVLQDNARELLLEIGEAVAAHRVRPGGQKDARTGPAELEPWPDEVDGPRLLDDLCAFIGEYIIMPAAALEASALWLLHTYLIDVADYTPYLWATSPVRECGKSTWLDLLAHLAHRALMTGGYTAGAITRTVDRDEPTLLLDELDTQVGTESGDAIKRILNTGFSRSQGRYTQCVGDEHEPRTYKTFCPKVLAGIDRSAAGWDTVKSRSIPISLARASKEERARLRKIRGHTIDAICLPLRRRMARWANDVRHSLIDADPEVPDELGARQSDIWRPLLSIADEAGGRWPDVARRAALALHGAAQDETEPGLLLLADLRELFATRGVDHLNSSDIVETLAKRDDRPWPEWKGGRPITAVQLSHILKRFGIRPKGLRFGPQTGRGYELAALRTAFARYLPAEQGATSNGPATQPATGVSSSSSRGLASGVAGVAGRAAGVGSDDFFDERPEGTGEAWEPDEAQVVESEP